MHIFKHSVIYSLYNMYNLFIYFQKYFKSILSFVIGFFQKDKSRAILLIGFTAGGISIVLLGWPVIGMYVYGFCLLGLIAYILVLHLRVRVNGGGELGKEVMALSHFQQ